MVAGCGSSSTGSIEDPATPPTGSVDIFPNGTFEAALDTVTGGENPRVGWYAQGLGTAPWPGVSTIENISGFTGNVLQIANGPAAGTQFYEQFAQYEGLTLRAGKRYTVRFKINMAAGDPVLTQVNFYVKLHKPIDPDHGNYDNVLVGMGDGSQFSATTTLTDVTLDFTPDGTGAWMSDADYTGVSLVFSFGGHSYPFAAFIDDLALIEE